MHCIVVKRNNALIGIFGTLLSVLVTLCIGANTSYAQSTGVYATLCGSTSSITISQPPSDSTVNTPTVPLSGTVAQANQIEIYVDDVFDSIIPLTIGQANYSGSVQLAAGTHTIMLRAIDSCSGSNGEASSVVTYVPPPSVPSQGGNTSTAVSSAQGGAVTITAPTIDEQSTPAYLQLPAIMTAPFQYVLEWLNINIADTTGTIPTLSLWRAIVIAIGMYLLVIGMAPIVIGALSKMSWVIRLLPNATPAVRLRILTWAFHVLGLLILLCALFVVV